MRKLRMRDYVISHVAKLTRNLFVASAISAVFFFVPSCSKSAPHKEAPPPAVGNEAPSFTLKDVNGRTVSLSDFRGKVVIIDFWATWCLPCRETTRGLNGLYRRYKDASVVILGVNMDGSGSAAKVRDFARKYDLAYPMLIDDGTTSRDYYVNKIPTTFVLNREHVILKIYPGYLPGLDRMIAEDIASQG